MVEVTAYTLMLSGKFLRYRDEYQDALEQLCVARDLLDKLAETADSSRNQALATLFADEISPEIRYCAHQLGHTKSYEVDAIVKELSPKHRGSLVHGYDQVIKKLFAESQNKQGSEGGHSLQPLLWDAQEVPIRNPELVDVLLQVQKAEAALKAEGSTHGDGSMSSERKSRKGVASYDAVLAALSDGDVARKLVESQQVSSKVTCRTDFTWVLTLNPTEHERCDFLYGSKGHPLCPFIRRLSLTLAAHTARSNIGICAGLAHRS